MFESINTKKNYQQIIEQIQGMIMDGTFKSGDRLPPERQLTEQMGVSRTSLREALKALEVLGLIESKQGEGSYIANNVDVAILKSISLAFKLNNGTLREIHELRYALEIQSIKMAARKGNPKEIEELQKIVDKMVIAKNEEESSELDILFHNTLVKGGNNILFHIIGDSISELLEPFIRAIRQVYYAPDEKLRHYYFIEQHQNIIDAIKEGDPEKAAIVLEEHIQLGDEDFIKMNKSKQTLKININNSY